EVSGAVEPVQERPHEGVTGPDGVGDLDLRGGHGRLGSTVYGQSTLDTECDHDQGRAEVGDRARGTARTQVREQEREVLVAGLDQVRLCEVAQGERAGGAGVADDVPADVRVD